MLLHLKLAYLNYFSWVKFNTRWTKGCVVLWVLLENHQPNTTTGHNRRSLASRDCKRGLQKQPHLTPGDDLNRFNNPSWIPLSSSLEGTRFFFFFPWSWRVQIAAVAGIPVHEQMCMNRCAWFFHGHCPSCTYLSCPSMAFCPDIMLNSLKIAPGFYITRRIAMGFQTLTHAICANNLSP